MKASAKILMVAVMVWTSCIDRVDLSLPPGVLPLVIDGLVTDAPGPYTVSISRGIPVDGSLHRATMVPRARVQIMDNTGTTDVLTETEVGTYVTDSLQGMMGRTYRLIVTMPDGNRYESTPEQIVPAGTIDSIYFDYEQSLKKDSNVELQGFNVYINATAAPGGSRRLRWRFNGTYKVITNPALLMVGNPPAPLACSIFCVCCTCWVSESEESPLLVNQSFIGSNRLNRVFVRYIPINEITFNEKYRVEITQMEVSQKVYDFLSAVRRQADNDASLFQPPFFELKGNVTATNHENPVVGMFTAAALTKRHRYIYRTDIPHYFFPSEIIGDCRGVAPRSSITEPPFWQ
ncbi:MAG: DUF4249 domain-containing protein [Cytophagales bacterium]|nr:DUF4249 domain-containing protein [Cytophagales bacterium]